MATISKHGVFMALIPEALYSSTLSAGSSGMRSGIDAGCIKRVGSTGVLLTGRSGIGKSELALSLIDRGHRLVADDAPLLNYNDRQIIGQCSEVLQDFLKIRNLGVVNIRFMYGENAVQSFQRLDLIIHLHDGSESDVDFAERKSQQILGVAIPKLSISVQQQRNLTLLVECAARDSMLRRQGYHADQDLQQRLTQTIARQTLCG